MTATLSIDAGQTGIKVRHRNGDAVTEWSRPGILTHLPLLPQLQDVLRAAADSGVRAGAVGIGVSGLTGKDSSPAEVLDGARVLGATELSLAHDSVTAFLGALGPGRGAVVAAGTGVVTLGVGEREMVRVDGWGNIFGDAGSGYWIGRAALDAAMRAHDGRGPETALLSVMAEEFPEVEAAYIELQSDPNRVRRVAGYSRAVDRQAADDAVARSILRAAAGELALSAVTALKRVGEAGPVGEAGASAAASRPVVRATGGVFRSERLAAEFGEAVLRLLPHADVSFGTADPLDGAELLLTLDPDSALAARVHRAVLATQA